MLSYEEQIIIDRPAAKVFDFLAHFDENYRWVGTVLSVEKQTPGPVRTGTKFVENVRFGPVANRVTWEVTVFDPPERLVHGSETFLGQSQVLFECTPMDDRTRLRVVTSAELRGFYRLAWPVLRNLGRGQRKKHLIRIKEELENR